MRERVESAKLVPSTCQEGVKRVSREWQMDVNRESKYVKRVPRRCQEGVKDSEFVKSLGFLSRLKRFNVLRGFQKYVKSCERVSRVVKRMSRGLCHLCLIKLR